MPHTHHTHACCVTHIPRTPHVYTHIPHVSPIHVSTHTCCHMSQATCVTVMLCVTMVTSTHGTRKCCVTQCVTYTLHTCCIQNVNIRREIQNVNIRINSPQCVQTRNFSECEQYILGGFLFDKSLFYAICSSTFCSVCDFNNFK